MIHPIQTPSCLQGSLVPWNPAMTQSNNKSQRVVAYFITSIFSIGFGVNGLLRGTPSGISEFSVAACGIGVALLVYSAYIYGRLTECQMRMLSGHSHLESSSESHFQ